MLNITLRGIDCDCHIGVPEEERASSQRVVFDVAFRHAEETSGAYVDYQKVAERVRYVAASRPFVLVEELVQETARELLQEFRSMQSLRVTVYKRPAVMPGIEVAVELEKDR